MQEAPKFVSAEKQKEIGDFLQEYIRELTLSPEKSEGFLYISAKDIKIFPAEAGGGIIEITEPDETEGVETFDIRNRFEKDFPQKGLEEAVRFENQVYNGEISPKEFSPEIGARFCLALAKLYQTKDDIYMSMPVLPPGGHKYAGRSKLQATNMVRGTFPKRDSLLKGAMKKETHTLNDLNRKFPQEKIVSNPEIMPTGLWTIRFKSRKGGYSELRNCHLQRDVETGTLDAFLLQKQFVFDEFDSFRTEENIYMGSENLSSDRVYVLASINDLKAAKEGEGVMVKKMFYKGNEIQKVAELDEKYRELFMEKDGQIYYKEFKAVPPLRAFLNLESKVLEQKSAIMKNEIRDVVGHHFEKKLQQLLSAPFVDHPVHFRLPGKDRLDKIIEGQPKDFQDWVSQIKENKLTIRPEFRLSDETIVEAKVGHDPLLNSDDKFQLYRNILYLLIKKFEGDLQGSGKIYYLMLQGGNAKINDFPGIEIEKIDVRALAKPDQQDWQSSVRKIAHGLETSKQRKQAVFDKDNLLKVLEAQNLTEGDFKTIDAWLKQAE